MVVVLVVDDTRKRGGLDGRQLTQSAVRAHVVVVVPPGCQHGPRVGQAAEQRLVQAFVAQPAVERLDEGVSRVGLPGAM